MAFLRRGVIRHPFPLFASITVHHKRSRTPETVRLADIFFWEEHYWETKNVTILYWGSSGAAQISESFEDVERAVNGKAMPHAV